MTKVINLHNIMVILILEIVDSFKTQKNLKQNIIKCKMQIEEKEPVEINQ